MPERAIWPCVFFKTYKKKIVVTVQKNLVVKKAIDIATANIGHVTTSSAVFRLDNLKLKSPDYSTFTIPLIKSSINMLSLKYVLLETNFSSHLTSTDSTSMRY